MLPFLLSSENKTLSYMIFLFALLGHALRDHKRVLCHRTGGGGGEIDGGFSSSLEHRFMKEASAWWSKSPWAIIEELVLPRGRRGWSGGHAGRLRDGIFVLVAKDPNLSPRTCKP